MTNTTSRRHSPWSCELCGATDPTCCNALPCGLHESIDGEPGTPECSYFHRWLASHCYGCGRHLTAAEIAEDGA